jgi:Fe-S oxidoreductase
VEIEMNESDLATKYRIEDCARCRNECADACPIYRHYGKYHPQELAHLYLRGGDRAAHDHPLIGACVTCRACTEACPFRVAFADFIRELRVGRTDFRPAFGDLIHTYQRKQAAGARPSAAKARGFWIDASLKLNPESGIVLFTGCLALFDAVTGGDGFAAMARAAVRLLNRLGVAPAILDDERCCGRDLYDIGERETFTALAKHNAGELAKARAKTVLTICPECAYTLKETYRKELGEQPFEVRHITEYLADHVQELGFAAGDEVFAFHDPCYLCRYLGIEDAPRTLLAALSTAHPVELDRHGKDAPCCGAGSLINHGPHTRTMVDDRLVEAHRAGAGALVMACPKCTLLYGEVLGETAWRRSPVGVKDLLSLAASRIAE